MNKNGAFLISNTNIHNINTKLKLLEVEAIPICEKCLFEIKLGEFICSTCKCNICIDHIKGHLGNHEIFKLSIKN
jgi:hypothetical protein